MTHAQCASQQLAVWVTVGRAGYCIRYYLSTAGGQGSTPVVHLSGDKLGRYNPKAESFTEISAKDDIDTEKLQQAADNMSKQSQTTAIHLARPGIDGSSGFHGHRRSWLELYVVNAALDAIKRKHGYAGFHLIGQSGGAGLVGGLIILREDIACAVAGAGALTNVPERKTNDPLLAFFDASREITRIASRRSTRFIVVTDPQDKRVQVTKQTPFANALARAGGRVEQYYVEAVDDLRHGVKVYSLRAVAGCVKGENQQQIAAALAKLQERYVAAAAERRSRKNAGAPTQPPG